MAVARLVRAPILLVPAILVGLLSAATRAQDAVAAQKEFKALAKQRLADLTAGVGLAKAAALADVALFDQKVAQGDFGVGWVMTLQDGLIDFQAAVSHELLVFSSRLVSDADQILVAHGPWGGVVPLGFLPGDAGTWDATRVVAKKRADKIVAAVLKRLHASSAKLLAREGVPLFVVLRTPQMPFEATSDVGSNGWYNRVSIDLAICGAGLIAVAGDAPASYGPLELEVSTKAGSLLFQKSFAGPDPATARFATSTWDDTQSNYFAPGMYGLLVIQGNTGFDGVLIGAR